MSATKVGYHYLYDPDYTPENGRYYDDTSPCSRGHYHKRAQPNIAQDSDNDADPPPLIDIKRFEYEAHNSLEFPEYPEFIPGFYNNDKLPEKVVNTKSQFRKKLEGVWGYCWKKISAFILYCKPLAAPLIKFYHKVYIPYVLVNLLNLLGGPKHAGRIGRYARISQFFGACLTWGTLIALIFMVGFASVWSLGLASPAWALTLGFGGVGINMTGSVIASAANHGKIDPFYREEIKLHDENNTLRKQLDIPEMELEHGYLHSSQERQNVHMHRYAHDAHTWVIGSGSTMTASILEFASIAMGLGGIFLMISRFSSIVSLFGASYVNQDRLSLFKKVISKKINSYYGLKHQLNHAKHKAIYQLLGNAFNDLKINRNHYYSRWVKFYCYRAIDAACANDADVLGNSEYIDKILKEKLAGLTETSTSDKMQFSRNKLRRFHVNELGKIRGLSDFDEEISVLDNMPVLEGFIRNSIENKHENYLTINEAVNTFQINNIYSKDETSILFMLYLKSSLVKALQDTKNPLNISDITSKNIEKAIECNSDFFCLSPDGTKKMLNKEMISQAYPLKGPHGAQIMPDYHSKILVQKMITPCLKQKYAPKNVLNSYSPDSCNYFSSMVIKNRSFDA